MHAVLPGMRERKSGTIVNISSIAGKRAIALGGIAYSASKFAMTALGTCVANEVAEDGVRVTNVYPGEVNTPILANRPTPVSEEHKQRILQPDDVARVGRGHYCPTRQGACPRSRYQALIAGLVLGCA